MPETIKKMSLGELHACIQKNLGFSHRAWQADHRHPFKSRTMAQGLEQVLYLCPSCKGKSSLRTKNNLIFCRQCGMTSRLDPFEHFISVKGTNPFADIPHWHRWESEQLEQMIRTENPDTPLFPPDRGVLFQIGLGNKLVTLTRNFKLTLTPEGIIVHRQDNGGERFLGNQETLVFGFDHIQSMIINAKATVELYRDGELYRIRIDRNASILKYTESYEIYKKANNSSSTGVLT